jgi:hypothetical protein
MVGNIIAGDKFVREIVRKLFNDHLESVEAITTALLAHTLNQRVSLSSDTREKGLRADDTVGWLNLDVLRFGHAL